MRTLTLSILAASIALIPASALAEQHRGGGQGPRPPAGGQWHGGGNMHGGQWRGGSWQNFRPGRNFQRHIGRGFSVHPFWFGSQFYVNDWQGYGFADPGPDQRWIRYYDDAYLIDRGGRVVDQREDFDWDRHGDDWEDDDGVPMRRGHRGRRHGDEDYEWFQMQDGRADGGWDYSQYGHGGPNGPPPPGYGYGGYGYGYGYYAYPIVIETTTTYGQSYSEEVVEEYVEVRRPRRHVRSCQCARPRAPAPRPRAPAPRPRPRPPAGERG
ncbi:MAG TPA: RcnB family protein [Allosphingosinicella sp.]|nr:RcnB family protein [Allosphingosinicella sp.]